MTAMTNSSAISRDDILNPRGDGFGRVDQRVVGDSFRKRLRHFAEQRFYLLAHLYRVASRGLVDNHQDRIVPLVGRADRITLRS